MVTLLLLGRAWGGRRSFDPRRGVASGGRRQSGMAPVERGPLGCLLGDALDGPRGKAREGGAPRTQCRSTSDTVRWHYVTRTGTLTPVLLSSSSASDRPWLARAAGEGSTA